MSTNTNNTDKSYTVDEAFLILNKLKTNPQTSKTSESQNEVDFSQPNEAKHTATDSIAPCISSGSSINLPQKVQSMKTPSASLESHLVEQKSTTLPRSSSESSIQRNSSHNFSKEINGKKYSIISEPVGSGGSSQVYAARCLDNGGYEVAIKYVSLKGMTNSVKKAYKDEIMLLEELQGSKYIIKMYDYLLKEKSLVVIMEKGETDLAKFIKNHFDEINDIWIKDKWYQMLRCVKVIHDKNIVHSDLKPANFLFVQAQLKLIDFGIASKIQDDMTSVIKSEHIGTLNYMSPEMLGSLETKNPGEFKVPLKADVWSLGCILYLMVNGQTPFQHVSQLMKRPAICSNKSKIEFPDCGSELLVDVLKRCLERDVMKRASVDELLRHPYLNQRQPLNNLKNYINPKITNKEMNWSEDDLVKIVTELKQYTPKTGARLLRQKFKSTSSLNLR